MSRTVTAIVPKGKSRVQVYLDGKSSFSLSKRLAREIEIDEILSEARADELQEQDAQEAAYQQATRLLALRPRSERELRLRYARKGFSQTTQESAIERLRSEGLVDDAAFAKAWIENRMEFRPRGVWALRAELRTKGIDREIIDRALEGFDDEEAARRAADQGARRYRHLSPELFRRRLSAYLSRRGFSYQIIAPLVAGLVEEESEGSQ